MCVFLSKCVYAKGSLGFQALVPGVLYSNYFELFSRQSYETKLNSPSKMWWIEGNAWNSFGQYYSGIQPIDVDNVVQQNFSRLQAF